MTRLARAEDQLYVGDDDGFVPISATDASAGSMGDLLALAARGELPGPADTTASRILGSQLSFDGVLTPETVGKLWGIGLNYVDHAVDLDEERPESPASFMKPSTTVTGPGGPIRLPPASVSGRVTAEAELGIVIGRGCSDIDPADVDRVVAGYVPVIDVTAEDILERNPRFLTRAKSFDTFLVLGPWITTLDDVDSESAVTVRTSTNGTVRAENRVENMFFSPRELVAFHSRVMTLQPGDVISTGTPGAHVISPADSVRAAVEGVGTVEADVVR